MPRYHVSVDAPPVWIQVEADNEDDAYELARDLGRHAQLSITIPNEHLPEDCESADVIGFDEGSYDPLDWSSSQVDEVEDDEEDG